MFNSPYAKGGMQTNGPAKPEYASGGGLNQNPGGMQQGGMQNPEGFTQQQQPWNQWGYLGQNPGGMQQGGMQNPDGFIQQQNPWAPGNWMNPGNRPQDSQSGGGWNQWGFNGFMGAGSNAPYNGPVGGGFQQQQGAPLTPGAPNPGQPGQATNAPNASIPAGPTMPQFTMGSANNPAVNLNGRDNPRRFMQRPSMSPQQMRQLTRPGAAPTVGYKPPDGTIDLPPGPVGY